MNSEKSINSNGVRFSAKNNEGKEVGHVYLFIMYNDLHEKPFGFVEDLFVEKGFRGLNKGKNLMKALITKAEELGCYKLIANSRTKRTDVHQLYKKIGFEKHGFEFRMEFWLFFLELHREEVSLLSFLLYF